MSDEQLDREIRRIVDELRRALQELAVVAGQTRKHREALVRIGAQAPGLMLADRHHLVSGDSSVDSWPTHEDLCRVLRLDRELRDRIAVLRGDLRQMGIGPELFE